MDESKIAIRELDQTITILSDVRKKFNNPSLVEELVAYDLQQLHNIYQRVRHLCTEIFGSTESFDAWVGPMTEFDDKTGSIQVTRLEAELAERLFDFVQGFRHFEKVEEDIERYGQENATLKKQLAELRQREITYLSILEKSKSSPSSESRNILLKSFRRQETIIARNLSALQEIKAKSGLNTPLDVLNGIEQYKSELEEVLANIADLEKHEL